MKHPYTLPFTHLLQLGSKLFVDKEVHKEICQVVKHERKTKVAADWSAEVDDVEARGEGHDEDDEQTETDLHQLHVLRLSCGRAENIKKQEILCLSILGKQILTVCFQCGGACSFFGR